MEGVERARHKEVEHKADYRQRKNEGEKAHDDARDLIPGLRGFERGKCKPCGIMLLHGGTAPVTVNIA